ncbi:hypothetical protein LJB86_02155 [Deltaproteobacteria bacterium OttesenSCG-928-M10]|nr:hypothetical protein [Deltaproteobacteria bacterium OttesenSCG-928-M10]
MRSCNHLAFVAVLLVMLAALGCSAKPARLSRPTAPPEGYQRRIVVVLERQDFRPVAGAGVKVETEAPTVLVSPAGGAGHTDSRGALTLVFEPKPHYDEKALVGDDIIVDFPVKAKLTITGAGRGPVARYIDDRETFARYADPLYQGLNRDPEAGETYYEIILP